MLTLLPPLGVHPGCANGKFECVTDGRCIEAHHRCDRDNDCDDGSDEQGCCKLKPQKSKAHFCAPYSEYYGMQLTATN